MALCRSLSMKKIVYLCLIFISCNAQLPPLNNLFECPAPISYGTVLKNELAHYPDDVIVFGHRPFGNTDYMFQFDKKGGTFINTNIIITKNYDAFHQDSLSELLMIYHCVAGEFDTIRPNYFSFQLINEEACAFNCSLSIGDSTLLNCSYSF